MRRTSAVTPVSKPRLAVNAALLSLIVAPALAGGVVVEVGADADFSAVSTYSWERGAPAAEDWVQQRIVAAVEAELAARGLQRVDGQGDVLVSTVAVSESVTGTTVNPGYWGGGADFGMPSVDIADYRKGVVYVTVKNPGDERVLWRARGKDRIRVSQSEEFTGKITGLIEKIFRKFPRKRDKR